MHVQRVRNVSEFVLYGLCLLLSFRAGLPIWGSRDFGSFYASGQAASRGDNPYGIYDHTFYIDTPWFSGYNQNLNPPTSLPLFEALAALPISTSFKLWWLVSVICFILMMVFLCRAYRDRADWVAITWMLSLGAAWDTLLLGQIYMPLALASCAAWLLLRRGDSAVLAGVLIGIVVAMKPNFLVWPGLLLLAGYYRCALSAFAGCAVLAGLSVLIYGTEIYLQWFELIAADGARAIFPTNGSIAGFFSRIGQPELGAVVGIALLAWSAFWAATRRPGVLEVSACALVVSLLSSPIAWAHYALFLIPILISVWDRRGIAGGIAAALLSLPLPIAVLSPADSLDARLTVGSLYLWAFLLVLVLVLQRSGRSPISDEALSGIDSDVACDSRDMRRSGSLTWSVPR